jgi:hypothetical protein
MRARRLLSSSIKQHRDRHERSQNREALTKAIPSVFVPRAETRLTVYCSPLVRMLRELVGIFPAERACIKLDPFLPSYSEVLDANVLVNLENQDSLYIEVSF